MDKGKVNNMANLDAANKARLEKSLEQIYKFDEGIMRLGEFLDKHAKSFRASETAKYQFDRRKYNRMGNNEQSEYEEKMKQTKTIYKAIINEERGAYIEIPKIVFEHYTK